MGSGQEAVRVVDLSLEGRSIPPARRLLRLFAESSDIITK
jgi:hypothetical protein